MVSINDIHVGDKITLRPMRVIRSDKYAGGNRPMVAVEAESGHQYSFPIELVASHIKSFKPSDPVIVCGMSSAIVIATYGDYVWVKFDDGNRVVKATDVRHADKLG